MKKFLFNFLIFVIPILIVGVVMEIYLRKTKNVYEIKADQLTDNAKKINVLILGNSHATYGVDPNQFGLYAFNVAQVSQSIYFDKRITLKYIDSLKNLKFVFISIDYHSLYFSNQNIRNDWSYYGYQIPFKNEHSIISENCYLKGYTPKMATTSLLKYVVNRKFNDKLFALDLEESVDVSKPVSKGWFSFKGSNLSQMSVQSCKARASDFKNSIKKSNEKKEILIDLEDFIIKLKSKKIIPILFTTPCYSEYNKILDKEIQFQNKKDIISLTNKYKIEYWNYLELPLQQSDFYNCDHLNASGAMKFSKILNNRLKNLKIINN
jgi:hypothetical protein